MTHKDDAHHALDVVQDAVDIAVLLAQLSIIEIETRGRIPADVCREHREALARAYLGGHRPGELRTVLREATNAVDTRGGCHGCTRDRLCDPCADGRDAAGLT